MLAADLVLDDTAVRIHKCGSPGQVLFHKSIQHRQIHVNLCFANVRQSNMFILMLPSPAILTFSLLSRCSVWLLRKRKSVTLSEYTLVWGLCSGPLCDNVGLYHREEKWILCSSIPRSTRYFLFHSSIVLKDPQGEKKGACAGEGALKWTCGKAMNIHYLCSCRQCGEIHPQMHWNHSRHSHSSFSLQQLFSSALTRLFLPVVSPHAISLLISNVNRPRSLVDRKQGS